MKNSAFKFILMLLVMSLITICLVACIPENSENNTPDANDTPSTTTSGGSLFDTTMSLAEFNKIKTGMTYSEVVEIVGCEGELMSEVDLGMPEYATQLYTWKGWGSLGANANVSFQGGKVISKAQIGLN